MVLCKKIKGSSFFTGGDFSVDEAVFLSANFTSERYFLTVAQGHLFLTGNHSKFLDIFIKRGLRGIGP